MASGDQKPTIKQLHRFVIPHISEIWEDVGIELELDHDGSLLDRIRRDRNGDNSKCSLDVMKAWLQGAGIGPKTWSALLDALHSVPGADKSVATIHANLVDAGIHLESSIKVPEDSEPPQDCTLFMPTTKQNPNHCPLDSTAEERNLSDVESVDPPYKAKSTTVTSTSLGGDMEHEDGEAVSVVSEVNTEELEQHSADSTSMIQSSPLTCSNADEQEQESSTQLTVTCESPETIEHTEVQESFTRSPEERNCEDTGDTKKPVVESTQQSQAHSLNYSLRIKPGQKIRKYQHELAGPGIQGKNYIICAPTGTGKTLVAGLVISDHLQKKKGKGRVIFIVDKKPLARQQTEAFKDLIPNASVQCSTGDDINVSIKTVLPDNDIIVCTAGKLLNELKEGRVHFREISLVVIDECHHANKESPHAKVLEKYLEYKEECTRLQERNPQEQLPQIFGLTASPGAGNNPTLDMEVTIEHLISLCALMDATSGIVTVEKYQHELDSHTNKPKCSLINLKQREPSEAFITLITNEMSDLERRVNLNCAFDKWTQKYETAIQQKRKILEDSSDPKSRDDISTLELLWNYSRSLEMYMDLRHEDAMSVLHSFKELPPKEKANSHERVLIENRARLIAKLTTLRKVSNPLLDTVGKLLVDQFTQKPDSKGIIFVRTKKHASSMSDWASHLSDEMSIRPLVLTGHTSETGTGMTQCEQELTLKNFHGEDCNLLISTSVAEEGLDVPACNFVIRFQHVSNEIAKVQTRGRARASDSVGFTILSSNTQKNIQEIKNGQLELLVEQILMSGENSCFPRGEILEREVLAKQEVLMRDRRFQKQFANLKGQKHKRVLPADAFELKCKKCKISACQGSDVYTLANATVYVIPDKAFRDQKIRTEPRHAPKQITNTMTVTDFIYCANCNTEWGNVSVWPASGMKLPVLKCKSFTFEYQGEPQSVKKWSECPFEVRLLSNHPEFRDPELECDQEM